MTNVYSAPVEGAGVGVVGGQVVGVKLFRESDMYIFAHVIINGNFTLASLV